MSESKTQIKNTCNQILTRGNRKGQACGKGCGQFSDQCAKHREYYFSAVIDEDSMDGGKGSALDKDERNFLCNLLLKRYDYEPYDSCSRRVTFYKKGSFKDFKENVFAVALENGILVDFVAEHYMFGDTQAQMKEENIYTGKCRKHYSFKKHNREECDYCRSWRLVEEKDYQLRPCIFGGMFYCDNCSEMVSACEMNYLKKCPKCECSLYSCNERGDQRFDSQKTEEDEDQYEQDIKDDAANMYIDHCNNNDEIDEDSITKISTIIDKTIKELKAKFPNAHEEDEDFKNYVSLLLNRFQSHLNNLTSEYLVEMILSYYK